jgi:hypothetical protein
MAISFDLVQALNNTGTAGQAVFGNFQAGYYIGNDPNTFTVFEEYRYRVGNADPYLLPLNTGMELGWFSNISGQNEYPHLAVENINGNAEITSSLWGESMYFHPGTLNYVYADYTSPESRPCVVRFTCPENGNALSIVGDFLKGDYFTNPAVGFAILKNGVEIFTRTVVTSNTSIPINLLNVPLVQGDVIDFVIDVNEGSGSQDDSAITVVLTLQLDKTPQPVVTTLPDCTTTTLSGTIPLAHNGTVTLQTVGGGTILGTGTITQLGSSSDGQWSITGLNLNTYGGQTLEVVALDAPSTVSDPTPVIIANVGCVSCTAPVVTTHPSSNPAVCVGDGHTMIVVATGTAPLSYQWKLGGVDISGETTDIYTATAAGSYTVTVTNACGSVTSNAATVTMANPPSVVSGGVFPDASEGVAYSHSIVLAGNLPITIINTVIPSWMTANIVGNTVTLSGTPGPADVTTDIFVLIELQNVCDSLILNEPIDVLSGCVGVGGGTISGPSEVAAFAPNTYTVSGLTGTGPFTYLWSVPASGGVLSGQGTASISAQFSTLGNVSVEITNCGGSSNKTINFPVSIYIGNAVDDTAITTANTPVVITLSANDVMC